MTNLIIRTILKKPYVKYTDEMVGNERHFTLYNKPNIQQTNSR